MVYIYNGDDTGGSFGRKFTITVNAGEGVSLDGCTGEFVFSGITKTLTDLVNGTPAEVSYTHAETATMPIGPGIGVFAIYDADGKRRTFNDKIHVVVTNDLSLAYPGASSVSVDVGSELVPATATTLGGVKVGDGLEIATDGTLSVDEDGIIEKAKDLFPLKESLSGKTVDLSSLHAVKMAVKTILESFGATATGYGEIDIDTSDASDDAISDLATQAGVLAEDATLDTVAAAQGVTVDDGSTVDQFIQSIS